MTAAAAAIPAATAQTTAPAPPTVANGVNHDYRLGKLLQIDPATGAVSIFAYGLRNPWRFSYDRDTGDLVIGDVGQGPLRGGRRRARRRAPARGANYGWDQYEGLHTYPGNAPARVAAPGDGHCPVHRVPARRRRARSPAATWCRDAALPELAGTYLYGDNCTGVISAATLPAGTRRARWA